MPSETLKPFLALSTSDLKKNRNIPLMVISFLVVIFCVFISIIAVWNVTKTNELRTELTVLQHELSQIKITFGNELMKELQEFKDFENEFKRLENSKALLDNEDDNDDDLNDYDDLYSSDEDEYNTEINDNDSDKIADLAVTNNDKLERKQRSISATYQGVPIIEESYLSVTKKNRSKKTPYAWMHPAVINSYDSKNPKAPQMHYDWSPKSNDNSGNDKYGSKDPAYMTPGQYSNMLKHRSSRNQQGYTSPSVTSTTTQDPIYNPNSRVMMPTEDDERARSLKHKVTHEEYARLIKNSDIYYDPNNNNINSKYNNYLEHVRPKEQVVVRKKSLERRRVRRSNLKRDTTAGTNMGRRHHFIGTHFVGYTDMSHHHRSSRHHGNGRVDHAGGIYTDWAHPGWMSDLNQNENFRLENGIVTVQKPGVYFVYAQIFYDDEHDRSGYIVKLVERDTGMDSSLMQCTVMTPSHDNRTKSNSCYTAAIAFIKQGEQIKIEAIAPRNVTFQREKSFFGLYKLGDIRQ